MLQQTQVRTVIPYYLKFTKRFPNVKDLAAADLQEVLKHWEGLGYYSRARNLHRAAQSLLETNNGRIPDNVEAFRKLIGVGPYIASAVMSIAFGHPLAVVDGNVKRVLARILMIKDPVNQASSQRFFQKAADEMLDRSDPGLYNQAVMELGALICRPRSPRCTACPVRENCRAFKAESTGAFPVRIKQKPVREIATVTAVICRRGRVLVTRRPETGLLGGLWEFPGGEYDKKEGLAVACRRIANTVTGLSVNVKGHLGAERHAYTHFKVTTDVVACSAPYGKVALRDATAFCWIPLGATAALPFSGLQRKIIKRLSASAGCPGFEGVLRAL